MKIGSSASVWTAMMLCAACAGTASATTITFDLGNGGAYAWSTSFSASSGGYTLTFTNPLGSPHQQTSVPFSDGSVGTAPQAPNNQLAFERDSNGLAIGGMVAVFNPTLNEVRALLGYTNGFTMTLSGPTNLLLKGYQVGSVSGLAPITTPFSLSQGATTLSSNNSLSSTGSFNIAGGPVFLADGASLQFDTSWNNDLGRSQIRYLTFEVASIPGAGVVSLSTIGLAAVSRRRRR